MEDIIRKNNFITCECVIKTSKQNSDFNDFNYFNKNHKNNLFGMYNLQYKEHYIPPMIAINYSLMGLPLVGNNFKVGGEKLDTRLSYIFAIRSGNGKKNLSEPIIAISKIMGFGYSKITSLHAEQLIGKKKLIEKGYGKNRHNEIEEIQGYFREDVLLLDDALPFLNNRDYDTSRQYFILGWDEYGFNEITKN